MRLANVDLRLLKVFLAVAKTRSYAAAQTELGIAASTISLHMSALEARLGMRLCDRGRSGFRLTAEGTRVLEETQRVFAAIEAFDTAIHAMHGSKSADCCAMTNACDGPGTNLMSLFAYLGAIERPVSTAIDLDSAPAFISASTSPLYRVTRPDAPPPKA